MPNRYDEDDDRMGRTARGYQSDRDESRGWRGERRPDYHGHQRENRDEGLARFGRYDDEMEYEGGYPPTRHEQDEAGYGGRSAMAGWREQGGDYGLGENSRGGEGGQARGAFGRGGTYGDRQGQYGTASQSWQEPYSRGYGQYGHYSRGRESQDYHRQDSFGYGRQGGYQRPEAFGQSNPRYAHDLNYSDWRDRQNRQFNEDFVAFNAEKQKQFDTEFDEWRRNRSQARTGSSDGQTTGQQPGLTSGQMGRAAETTGKPDEISSKKT